MDPKGGNSDWEPHDLVTPAQTLTEASDLVIGKQAEFRVAYAGMEVPGFPTQVQVGKVAVTQVRGPLQSQRTTITQVPGLSPVFRKWMEKPLVGAGRILTVFRLEVEVPADISAAMSVWRAECLAASGFLTMLLDERLVEEHVLEELTIFTGEGDVLAVVDERSRVRTYEPSHRWFNRFDEDVARYQQTDPAARMRLNGALRWYQRAATAGPTAEGFVLLWIAIEAILPAAGGGRSRNEVRAVEEALLAADPSIDLNADLDPSIGQLAGLRARVVHQGLENDGTIQAGWYTLEMVTRLLLRHAFGVEGGWPLAPAVTMLRSPWSEMRQEPRTEWLSAPGLDRP